MSYSARLRITGLNSYFSMCVEDITIRVTRPGGAKLRHNGHHAKPSAKLEDGGSIMGLRPGDGLRPVVITAVMVKLVV